jgi:proteasome lid subunit RPN8/RPN11
MKEKLKNIIKRSQRSAESEGENLNEEIIHPEFIGDKPSKNTNGVNRHQALTIHRSVLEQIKQSIGTIPAESGGPLGGNRDEGVVTHFYFDHSAKRSGATYSPDHELVNRLFAEEWNPNGVNLLGFAHSHPPGYRRPSGGDISYAERILDAVPELPRLLLPIIIAKPDAGAFEFLPFAAYRDRSGVRIELLELIIVNDDGELETEKETNLIAETFRRVQTAYDLPHLEKCRIVYVGTGGAAAFIEDLARAGVGQHILIDPDTVSVTNLATQQVYRRDIGCAKVECIAERLRDINPQALVIARQNMLDDFDDREMRHFLTGEISGCQPKATLLCGLTDNFHAQARINRLALQFEVSSLCAQVYWEGRGAEITFTFPGVPPACHRCATSARYKAFLEDNFENNVTSDGTPIFATTRLNALKGFIALALLHHGTNHPRWGGLLARMGKRNLVQMRLDPDFSESLGIKVFDRVFDGADHERLLFDETVWLPQEADSPASGYPNCPDCGGTGDLRKAAGTFNDTRPMRQSK